MPVRAHLEGKIELIERFEVSCLSYEEAMAEKVRAAITRREIAIRDFFDVDHAAQSGMDFQSEDFIRLLTDKLAVPGTGPAGLSDDRVNELRRQLDAQLRPVLRADDFNRFDLDRAIDTVRNIIDGISCSTA